MWRKSSRDRNVKNLLQKKDNFIVLACLSLKNDQLQAFLSELVDLESYLKTLDLKKLGEEEQKLYAERIYRYRKEISIGIVYLWERILMLDVQLDPINDKLGVLPRSSAEEF